MKRIGILTSGGDSPGMNSCIRAVVRTALSRGIEIWGIRRGYAGLIEDDLFKMDRSSVSDVISLGGTILGTARSEEFRTQEGRRRAYEVLLNYDIQGIVACGGDGTFRGALDFLEEYPIPIVGTPGTIDNDIYGTDYTIGYDTAVNTAMEAVDKIRDTAESHDRTFFVEVMGRNAGFIALDVGLSTGAEYVAIPERKTNFDVLCKYMEEQSEKRRHIFIISEGDDYGNAQKFAEDFKERFDVDTRVTILGHIQRGGSPTARDRILASRLGVAAVDELLNGRSGVMLGDIKGEIIVTSMHEATQRRRTISEASFNLIELLK